MPTVRSIPPGGVPGLPLPLRRTAHGTLYMGDDITSAGSDPQMVHDWTVQVTGQGLVPTRMPTGILKGQLATRLQVKDPTLGWNYQLAPFLVRVADNFGAVENQLTITDGQIAAAEQAASQAVLAGPGDFLSAVTSLPKWVLYVGGAVLLYGVLVTVTRPYLPRGSGRAGRGY